MLFLLLGNMHQDRVEEAVYMQIILLTSQQTVEQLNLLCIKKEMLRAGKDAKRKEENNKTILNP